jgi:tight adherence protein C
LFANYLSTRKKLISRILQLAPGSNFAKKQGPSKRIRTLSKSDQAAIDSELTDFVDMLSTTLLSGESLFVGLNRLTEISNCLLSKEIGILLRRVDLGGEITSELSALCQRIPTASIREFTNKLSLAIARGTPLANSLISLSSSLRKKRATSLLRLAGINETKMLVPVVLLVCPVTVIFALYPSSQLLTVGIN